MDSKMLTPKLFDFHTYVEYEEWFSNHSSDILEPGEVWFAKLHDLDEYRMFIGTGSTLNKIIAKRIMEV